MLRKGEKQIARSAWLLLILASLLVAAEAQGQSQSLSNQVPVQDTYVSQNNGSSNFGSNSFGWLGDIAGANALYLQYDLLSIPPDSVIVSATLSFQKRTTTHSGDMLIELRKRRAAWDSASVTWNNSDPFRDPIAGSSTINTSLSFPNLTDGDLKAIVADWVRNPSSNHGLTILPAALDGTSTSFYMKENTLGGNPIRLSVLYQPGAPPTAPTWLRTTLSSPTSIDLLWDDNAGNEDGFKVERKAGPAGPWTIIATLPADAETYQDNGLTCGMTYSYRVWAFNAAGDSGKTNEAGATPECACTETLSSEGQSFDALGGTGSFGVTACGSWTAVSDASWITVTSGASGSGNGTVGFRVDRNNVQSARTGTISLPELGLAFTVQQAAAPGDPGFSSFLRLVSGTVAGQAVDPDHRTVTVQPGAAISGSLTFRIDSSFPSNAVMAMGITPSWGNHATSYASLGGFSTPASALQRTATLNYTAPSTLGTYHVIAAFRGEFNAGQVLSATNWSAGTLVWNNGDDIPDWSADLIEKANRDGNVLANYLYSNGTVIPTWVPATAITIVVQSTSVQPPAAPTWLRTTPSSPTSIDLLWDDNASNEDGFKVERKVGPAGPWTIIATLPVDAETYQDTGLTCGATYAYRVWAFNAGGDSGKTNEAGATPGCN